MPKCQKNRPMCWRYIRLAIVTAATYCHNDLWLLQTFYLCKSMAFCLNPEIDIQIAPSKMDFKTSWGPPSDDLTPLKATERSVTDICLRSTQQFQMRRNVLRLRLHLRSSSKLTECARSVLVEKPAHHFFGNILHAEPCRSPCTVAPKKLCWHSMQWICSNST